MLYLASIKEAHPNFLNFSKDLSCTEKKNLNVFSHLALYNTSIFKKFGITKEQVILW